MSYMHDMGKRVKKGDNKIETTMVNGELPLCIAIKQVGDYQKHRHYARFLHHFVPPSVFLATARQTETFFPWKRHRTRYSGNRWLHNKHNYKLQL